MAQAAVDQIDNPLRLRHGQLIGPGQIARAERRQKGAELRLICRLTARLPLALYRREKPKHPAQIPQHLLIDVAKIALRQ